MRRFGDLIEAQLPEKQWFGRYAYVAPLYMSHEANSMMNRPEERLPPWATLRVSSSTSRRPVWRLKETEDGRSACVERPRGSRATC